MTDTTIRTFEEIAAEFGQKLHQVFKDVSGQTKREAQKAAVERVVAEKEQAETDMRQGLFTMTRCFHTAKTEDTPENQEEFDRAAIFYMRGWKRAASHMEQQCKSIIGLASDVCGELYENGAITDKDREKVTKMVGDVYVNYGAPAREQILNYEEPQSIEESVKWSKEEEIKGKELMSRLSNSSHKINFPVLNS